MRRGEEAWARRRGAPGDSEGSRSHVEAGAAGGHPDAAGRLVPVGVDARLRVRVAAHGPRARLDVARGEGKAEEHEERQRRDAGEGVDADGRRDQPLVVLQRVGGHPEELPDEVQLRAPEVQDPRPEGADEEPEEAGAEGAGEEEAEAGDEREDELHGHRRADHRGGVVLHELRRGGGGGEVRGQLSRPPEPPAATSARGGPERALGLRGKARRAPG